MANCKECVHYESCFEYGNILDPIHGGVVCDSFKNKTDFVEVVRCKDCGYCELQYPAKAIGEEPIEGYFCWLNQKYVEPTGFCSRGQRKDSIKNDLRY